MSISAAAPWLSYYGTTPPTLDYPDLTMYQLLAETAGKYPDHTAYLFQGKKTSYTQIIDRVEAAAKALYHRGIRKGDRVTICMPNCPQALDCFYALNRLGAVANMIHPLSAAQEIAFYIQVSHSKAILTLDLFYGKVASILPQLLQPCGIWVARIADELPLPLRLVYSMTKNGRCRLPKSGPFLLWQDLLEAGNRVSDLPADDGKADAPAVILYSGGTTGDPKGVLLSSRNFNALGLQTIAASGFGSIVGMKMLSVMPIFHGFGLGIGIHTALIGGAACILVPQFSIKTYAKTLLRQKPNIIPGVPTLFEALLRSKDLEGKDLSFLRGIFSGGDSLSPELKKKVDAFLWAHNCTEQIREGYGATECIAASCLTPKDYAREASIGVPFPDTFYKIVTPGTAREVDAHTDGEICISGPTVMLGYMDDQQQTAAALQRHADGKLWLHTGDMGAMDEDGFVYFKQRIKRMIVTSGYNVYPSQLENVLDSHEKVAQSCCIGVPDAYRGQKILAYVVPAPGTEPTEALKQDIFAFCRQRIARYALPKDLIFCSDLPRTPVGKVAYRELEAEAAKEEHK